MALEHIDLDYLSQGLESLLSDTARDTLGGEDKCFFKPARREIKRDLGAGYDPVAQAFLTQGEVQAFFSSFFMKLHPLLPILDPMLHTPECEFSVKRSIPDAFQSFAAGPPFSYGHLCPRGIAHTWGRRSYETVAHTCAAIVRVDFSAWICVSRSSCPVHDPLLMNQVVQAFLIWMSWLPSSMPFQEERL